MNRGELQRWKEIIKRWGGTTDCMPIQQTLVGIIDALLKEDKPTATEVLAGSHWFDVDFSCPCCQRVLTHLLRTGKMAKVRIAPNLSGKQYHIIEDYKIK